VALGIVEVLRRQDASASTCRPPPARDAAWAPQQFCLIASVYGAKFAAMRYATSIEPITVLKTKSAELVRRTRRSGEPIIITQNGRAAAVLQDVETFEQQRRALLLLRFLAEGHRQLNHGRGVDADRAARRLRRRIEGLRRAGTTPA